MSTIASRRQWRKLRYTARPFVILIGGFLLVMAAATMIERSASIGAHYAAAQAGRQR